MRVLINAKEKKEGWVGALVWMPDTNFFRFWHLTLFDCQHPLSYKIVLKHFRILQFTDVFER